MLRYIIRRLLISIPVFFGITAIAFAALAAAPGDPIYAMVDPQALQQMTPEAVDNLRHQYGLDQPAPIRYVKWVRELASGNLGYSISSRRSIEAELSGRLGATLQLMGTALAIGILVGIPLGMISATKQYSKLDYALTVWAFGMIAMPPFFLGLILIYVFGVHFGVLPTGGRSTLGEHPNFVDTVKHMVMPATVLGLGFAAPIMRYVRSSMLEVLRQDYLTTARAKGLAETPVLVRHAARNAILPVVTVIGLHLPELVAGAVITEQVFQWPGMGQMAVKAATSRDPSLMQGVVLVVGVAVLVSNLVVDIVYTILDPRIRYE
jgi:peptide/nickel transport system permease protein